MIDSTSSPTDPDSLKPGRFYYSPDATPSVVFGHLDDKGSLYEVFSFDVSGTDSLRLIKSANSIIEALEFEIKQRKQAEERADRARSDEARLQLRARHLLATFADVLAFHRKTGFALKSYEAKELLETMEESFAQLSDTLNT
jgi:hypothetical protein